MNPVIRAPTPSRALLVSTMPLPIRQSRWVMGGPLSNVRPFISSMWFMMAYVYWTASPGASWSAVGSGSARRTPVIIGAAMADRTRIAMASPALTEWKSRDRMACPPFPARPGSRTSRGEAPGVFGQHRHARDVATRPCKARHQTHSDELTDAPDTTGMVELGRQGSRRG